MIKLTISNVCKAFDADAVIGTKVPVGGYRKVLEAVIDAIEAHVPGEKETPGQYFLQLPDSLIPYVICGDGKVPPRDADPNPFVVREWRGQRQEFLRREYALPTTGVAAVVYTRDAYLANDDPDLTEAEKARVDQSDCTHVVVALLAFGGPSPRHTLSESGRTVGITSPERLEANIAGANDDFKGLSQADLDEIRRVTRERHDSYRTVAD